jgi:hypothetical protein
LDFAAAQQRLTDLALRQRETGIRLSPALYERALLFVGIGVIARPGRPDVAAKIWSAIEKKRSGRYLCSPRYAADMLPRHACPAPFQG